MSDQSNTDSWLYKKKTSEIISKPFEKALGYFPELHDTYIFTHEALFYGVQHTVRSYPPLVILHWPKSKWVYPIVINKHSKVNISFYTLTEEQQVGLLLHELSHISTYINYSRSDIIILSFKYLINKKFVRNVEKSTDMKVIKKGAGFYLLAYRLHIAEFRINHVYPETQDTYMTPDELIDNMKKYSELYESEKLEVFIKKLEEVEKNNRSIMVRPTISFTREIKHSLKTLVAFIPAFIEMFYHITIKKVYRK